MKKFFKKFINNPSDLWSIPNILVYFRFILVIVFCVIYFTPIRANGTEIQNFLAAGVVLLAGFTDFLDGQIARRCNMTTELGKVIDPLADKLMQFVIVICLSITFHQYWTFFLMLAIFVAKELTLLVFDIILFAKGKKLDGARWCGKLSTFVFYVTMGILLLLPTINAISIYIATSITSAFLLYAFIAYFPILIRLHNETSTIQNKESDQS